MLIGEQRIAGPAGRQPLNVAGHQGFQSAGRVVAVQEGLAHMRNVEHGSLLAGVQMLFHDTAREMYGHVVPGEGHHLAAQFPMQRMEWGLFDILAVLVVHVGSPKTVSVRPVTLSTGD